MPRPCCWTGSARCSSSPAMSRPPGRRTAAPWTCSPTTTSSRLAARVYAGYALLEAAWAELDSAEAAASHALAISRALGARRPEGTALNALGLVAATRGDLDRGVAQLRESLAIAREVQSPHDVGLAYVNLSHVLGLASRLDDGVALCREGVPELGRYGQDRQFGSLLLCNTSDALIKAGRLAEAEELINDALSRHPRGVMAAPVLLLAARLTVAQGDLTVAWERCEQARLVIEAEGAPLGWLRGDHRDGGRGRARGPVAPRRPASWSPTASRRSPGPARPSTAARWSRWGCGRSPTRRSPSATTSHGPAAPVRASSCWRRWPTSGRSRDTADCPRTTRSTCSAPPSRPASTTRRPRRTGRQLPPPGSARPTAAHGVRALAPGGGPAGERGQRRVDRGAAVGAHGGAAARRRTPGGGDRDPGARGTGSTCCPPPDGAADRDTEALEAYALTAREREVLAALAAGHDEQGDRRRAVHQREDRLGARLQHPAQARRGGRQEAARVAHRLGVSPADMI